MITLEDCRTYGQVVESSKCGKIVLVRVTKSLVQHHRLIAVVGGEYRRFLPLSALQHIVKR